MVARRSYQRAGRTRRGLVGAALVAMQVAAVLPLGATALAASVVTTPGATFTTTPVEGATSLTLSYTLANSGDNVYPWEQRSFYMDGFCVDPYGEPARVYSAGAGNHPSGKSDTLNLPCPEGTQAQRFTIWVESRGTVLEWKTGVAPLPPPPWPPGVTAQVDGAKFTKVPVAGSPRFQVGYELKSTPNEYMLGDSEGYPWEMDSFIIDALCINAAGQYKSVYQGLAGNHPGGKTDQLDIACPTGMTPGRFAVTMHEGPHRGKHMLEWVVPVDRPIGQVLLEPAQVTRHTGMSQELTATVLDANGAPVQGALLDFSVASGPHAGIAGRCEGAFAPFLPRTCQTDANGQIAYRYPGTSTGTDRIKAYADMDGDRAMDPSEPRATAEVKWVEALRYVALGDSFSSGEGLPAYFDDGDCHRSGRAYSTLVTGPHYASPISRLAAEGLYGTKWDFIACSGAVTADVVSRSQHEYQPPQLAQGRVDAETDLVTMTIGGNDVGFADILKACGLRRCTSSTYKPLGGMPLAQWVPAKIDAVKWSLVETYAQVRQKAPEAAVVVLGYPQLFPATEEEQRCTKLRLWDTGEQTLLRSMSVRFNDRLTEATAMSGVHYVDPMSRWAGHEICGNGGEWIHALTLYVDTIPGTRIPIGGGPTDQSFHPNQMGQAAYAAQVDDYLREAVAAPGAALLPGGLPRNPAPEGGVPAPGFRRSNTSRRAALQQAAEPTGPLGSISDAGIAPADPASSTCRTDGVFARRQEVRVTGDGFVPGSEAAIDLVPYVEAESQSLATTTAGSGGRIDEVVRIPRGTAPTALAGVEVKGSDAAGGDRLLIETFAIDESNFLCDDAPPVVTVEAPVDGGSYLLGQDVIPSFACHDAKSGVETCIPESTVLDTSTPGSHTFSVRATDVAGNETVTRVHYSVHYNFDGFSAPVDGEPVVNRASAGQTIPFKWRITTAQGIGVGDPASFTSISVLKTTCDDSAPLDAIEVDPATTGLRYHGAGYWQMNWQSPRGLAGSCATVTVMLADGATAERSARFSFR